MNDVVQLDVGLYNGDRLKLTVVVVTGGATARQRDERAVRLRRVVKPRAEVVICGAETAAAFQLKRYTDTHIAQHKWICRRVGRLNAEKFLIFPYFLFFMVFKRDFTVSDALSLLVAQLQTQQVMTSQIRSHIKHLTQTYYIPVPILQSKLMKTLAFVAGFNTI